MAFVMNQVISMSKEVGDIADEVEVFGYPLTELTNFLQRLEEKRATLRQQRLDVLNNMTSKESTPEETKLLTFIKSALESLRSL